MKKLFLILIIVNCSLFTVNAQWVNQVSGTSSLLNQVFFPSPDTGYIFGEVAFLKTTNGGSNWNFKSFVPDGYFMYFTSNNTGFSIRNDSVFKTTDGADTWQAVFHKDQVLFQPFFINPDTGYIIGEYIGDSIFVYKTVDAGNTWSFVHSEADQTAGPIARIHFINNNIGFLIYMDGTIIRTNDGGNSWTTVYFDIFNMVGDIQFPTPTVGYAVGDKIIKSQDAGLTWSVLTTPVTSEYLRSVYFTSADTGFIVGGNGMSTGCIIETNNGGANWTLSVTANQTFTSVYFPSSDIGYTCGTNGKLMKYTNGTASNSDFSTSDKFSIYPNPAHNKLTITTAPQKQTTVTIFNMQGQLVKQIPIPQSPIEIDVSGLAKGIYIVKVQSENEVVVRKFVKQ